MSYLSLHIFLTTIITLKTRAKKILVGIIIILISASAISALAYPYMIKIDISSITGSDFELEFNLYDNNATLGDSYVLIDNIFTDNGLFFIDFESNTLEGFSTSYNPGYINVVPGNLSFGDYSLRLDEDPSSTPTITFRDFTGSAANFLFFDFELVSSSNASGLFGHDSFVASLLDPITLGPLIPGLTPDLGDFLEAKYDESGLKINLSISMQSEIIEKELLEVGPSGEYPYIKIQDALVDAKDYDVILVYEGIYTENINFLGKAVIVQCLNGPQNTIIDGHGQGPVVTFSSGETATSILCGFTIRNGYQQNIGGGIFCRDSSPLISDNIITNNEAGQFGGGIYCSNASPRLVNNVIVNNMSVSGGGIYCCLNSSPYLLLNTIAYNSSTYGGGIYSDGNNSLPLIVNSIFWNDNDDLYGIDPNYIHYSIIRDGEFIDRNNNRADDPKFWKPNEGNFRLSFDSPCIDAGDNSVLGLPGTDQEGNPRILGCAVDLGPYEYGEPDQDQDGYPDYLDCDCTDPNINPGVAEVPGDGKDNDCDPNTPVDDQDDDLVKDDADNCPEVFNPGQEDNDSDGRGNLCDICINDPDDDIDGDGICGDLDFCVNDFDLEIISSKGLLENFELGRNVVTIDTSCYPYTSYNFLSAFRKRGDILLIQHKKPASGDVKATYWFFDRVSGDEIEFPEDASVLEDAKFVIDKIE